MHYSANLFLAVCVIIPSPNFFRIIVHKRDQITSRCARIKINPRAHSTAGDRFPADAAFETVTEPTYDPDGFPLIALHFVGYDSKFIYAFFVLGSFMATGNVPEDSCKTCAPLSIRAAPAYHASLLEVSLAIDR